jgi:hypothetical protein
VPVEVFFGFPGILDRHGIPSATPPAEVHLDAVKTGFSRELDL